MTGAVWGLAARIIIVSDSLSLCCGWKAKYVNKFVQILNFVFTVGQGMILRPRQLHQARTTDNWNVENIVFRRQSVSRTGIMLELFMKVESTDKQVVGAMRGNLCFHPWDSRPMKSVSIWSYISHVAAKQQYLPRQHSYLCIFVLCFSRNRVAFQVELTFKDHLLL